jgi:hypothetical protein
MNGIDSPMLLQLNTRAERLLILLLLRPMLLLALVLGTGMALMDGSDAITGGINDKLLHFAGFAALAFLVDYSLPGSRSAYWRWQLPLLLFYGGLIEIVQGFLPHRSADLLDLLANAAGLIAYGGLRPLLALIWRPAYSPR